MIYFVNFNDKSIRTLKADFELANKNLRFIVDTGASCSILDQHYLPKNIHIYHDNKIKIRGINGICTSVGYIKTYLQFRNIKFSIILHVVPSLPPNITGLLGTDFLQRYQAKINFETNFLLLRNNKVEVNVPLLHHNSIAINLPARTEVVTCIDYINKEVVKSRNSTICIYS